MRNLYIRTLHQKFPKLTNDEVTYKISKKSMRQIPMIRSHINLNKKRKSRIVEDTKNIEESDPDTISTHEVSETPLMKAAQVFQDKYELLEKLGEGTSGLVRKCRNTLTNEFFAVKSFSFEDEQLPNLQANFLLMKKLRHKNILRYEALYIDMKKRTGWLVMGFVQAPSLQKVKLQSEQQIKKVMFQVFDVLAYLHRHNTMHRDIKGSNILCDPKTKQITIIDFGLAKKFKKRGAYFDMWTITGTLCYRAPEMFEGQGYRDTVDVWAAGILLYKLVAGRTPFESQYHYETINNIRTANLKFTPEFDKYSDKLRQFVCKLLQRDTQKRPLPLCCLRKTSWFQQLCSIRSQNKKQRSSLSRQKHKNSLNMGKQCTVRSKVAEGMSLNLQLDELALNDHKIDHLDEKIYKRNPVCIKTENGYFCI